MTLLRSPLTTLERYRGRLTGTELLQLFSVLASHLPDQAAAGIERILRVIETCIRDWRTTTPDPARMADRRGTHFLLVSNIALAPLEVQRPDLIGEVFGAWLGIPAQERRRDLLFWLMAREPGMGWATRVNVSVGEPAVDPVEVIVVSRNISRCHFQCS